MCMPSAVEFVFNFQAKTSQVQTAERAHLASAAASRCSPLVIHLCPMLVPPHEAKWTEGRQGEWSGSSTQFSSLVVWRWGTEFPETNLAGVWESSSHLVFSGGDLGLT